MVDFFLRNAGAKLKTLARWCMGMTLLGVIGMLLTGLILAITAENPAAFFGLLLGAVALLLSGWSFALVLQCIGEAAPESTFVGHGKGWRCKCGRVNTYGSGSCPRCGALRHL